MNNGPVSVGVTVGIVGVSGYSGMEVCRLVAGHPGLALAVAVSDRWAGSPLGDQLALPDDAAAMRVLSQEEGVRALGDAELWFLCTPAEVSMDLAPRALEAGARVVDLSGAFRLAAEDYPRWYGFP